MRDKGRVQNVNARLYDPGFRRQIGAGGQVADQAELGEQQRSRTLRANELARGIEGDTCQQVAIGGDLARLDAAADQHRSEERRVGKECVSTCRSRWSTYP